MNIPRQESVELPAFSVARCEAGVATRPAILGNVSPFFEDPYARPTAGYTKYPLVIANTVLANLNGEAMAERVSRIFREDGRRYGRAIVAAVDAMQKSPVLKPIKDRTLAWSGSYMAGVSGTQEPGAWHPDGTLVTISATFEGPGTEIALTNPPNTSAMRALQPGEVGVFSGESLHRAPASPNAGTRRSGMVLFGYEPQEHRPS